MKKYSITLYGLFGSIGFALVCILLYLLDIGGAIFLLFYLPGLIFGLLMAKALQQFSQNVAIIVIASTIVYFAMLFLCGKNIEFLSIRRLSMGGIGAILFLMMIRLTTTINIRLKHYILGFIMGIATTFFMWTNEFEGFNPWLVILSIVLWQTSIAGIINLCQSNRLTKETT